MIPFEEIYHLNILPMYKYALRVVKVREDAQDICSKVFVKFYKLQNEIKEPRYWLFTAAKHECIDFLRHKKRYREVELFDFAEEIEESPRDAIMAQLYLAIENLTPFKKKVLELSIEGLTPWDIALKLGIKYQSVRNEKCRALKDLRNILIGNTKLSI